MVGEAGRVYAFEPVVPELCRHNVERNGVQNVTVIPKGVSNRAENIEFEFSDFCLDSKLCGHETAAAEGSRRRAVPVVRLDDWMTEENLQRLDFIKIDIEGAEEPALRGGQRLIERFKPKLSISSYHVDSVSELQHPKLVKLLREWGYQIEELGKQHIFAW
jgi:FkbM family methyltransferase